MNRRWTVFPAFFVLFLALAQFAVAIAEAQTSDPRVADLVQTGKLRVGIGLANLGSAIKDPASGELRGIASDLARALAARIGVALQPVEYPRPGAVLDGVSTGAWDVAFLVVDPARSAIADVSLPYMQSDFGFLVPAASSIRNLADADQPGNRIAVPRGDAIDLTLSRLLKQATVVRVDNQAAGAALLRAGQISAYAAPRPVLLELSAQLPGSRVTDEAFASISFVAFIPKGHAGHLAYVSEFLEEAKASGLVQQFIDRSGMRGFKVASFKPN